MRRIIVGAQVSMDGVMQAPGGPTEDPTKGFRFGGWAMPYFDQEFGEEIDRVFKEKFDLLLGRKTYEIFAGYWPYYDETAPAGGIAKLFKDIKKYVVSRSGDVDTSWQRSVLPWVTRFGPSSCFRRFTSAMSRRSTEPVQPVSTSPERETAYFLISLNRFAMPPAGAFSQ